MNYKSVGEKARDVLRRVRLADYLTTAQLFLQDNFLLTRPLTFDDIKPRLLGHWGSCHGINLVYALMRELTPNDKNVSFILGPGHGFPALNANLFIDRELVDKNGEKVKDVAILCREFSWPGGFPSHSSPMTPGVITEGGELGYALGAAYGQALGHPEKTIVVLLGDGEMETATALGSLNLNKLIPAGNANGKVIPVLHINGYKISGPTILGRKSERETHEMLRGFGYTPIEIEQGEDEERSEFLERVIYKITEVMGLNESGEKAVFSPIFLLRTEKGETGPEWLDGKKIKGNYLAHQIPLPLAKSDEIQLKMLEDWLKSYKIEEIYDRKSK